MTAPTNAGLLTNDPLYAYNVPGYTNQNQGGAGYAALNVEGNVQSVPGSGSELVEPAALSGYITRSYDPDVTSAGGTAGTVTFTSGTAILAAVQVLDVALTTKVVVTGKAAGTATHSFAALYSAQNGTQIAKTADQTSTAFGTTATAINWASSAVLTPGYYWVLLYEQTGTTTTLVGYTLSAESQLLLTGTGVLNYTVGSSPRFAIGGTGLTGLTTAPPAALLSTMVVSAASSAWFVGLA